MVTSSPVSAGAAAVASVAVASAAATAAAVAAAAAAAASIFDFFAGGLAFFAAERPRQRTLSCEASSR